MPRTQRAIATLIRSGMKRVSGTKRGVSAMGSAGCDDVDAVIYADANASAGKRRSGANKEKAVESVEEKFYVVLRTSEGRDRVVVIHRSESRYRWVHSGSFHDLDRYEVLSIRRKLLEWYDENQRILGWRIPTPKFIEKHSDRLEGYFDPVRTTLDHAYGVLVAEFMSQQTQLATVSKYWKRWVEKFPTLRVLANASLEQVNEYWAGLGYYRRAYALHECAKIIVRDYDGVVPRTAEELAQLPGIGQYTSGAIASTAYDQVVPIIDGNVARVMSRLCAFGMDSKCRVAKKWFWDSSSKLVDPSRPGDYNQGIMELGAMICTTNNPKCVNILSNHRKKKRPR
ncbi:adenine DNA glycosylase-like [Schistocerca gregaria]|uniref:adenine DNA glycosylase-like n=1 Tax=Schistocerca gregaria TaxID=7010 RepID=UPI00211E0437|nr:adenine DNA glycosylase-like [Schistocerca gregaria]